MRDARHIQERAEIRMDRMQAVWLALGAAMALGLVFALGVVVGRHAARIEPGPAAADPLAEIRENERVLHRFYETLTDPPQRSGSDHRQAERPPQARGPAEPSSTPTTQPAGPEERAAGVPSNTKHAEPTTVQASTRPPPALDASRDAARRPAGDAEAIRSALGAGPPGRGDYTLQVSAFQIDAEAQAFAAALQRKGFSPFVRRADIPGKGTWYRVRMGRFASEEVAREAKSLLSRSDIPAWVLRAD